MGIQSREGAVALEQRSLRRRPWAGPQRRRTGGQGFWTESAASGPSQAQLGPAQCAGLRLPAPEGADGIEAHRSCHGRVLCRKGPLRRHLGLRVQNMHPLKPHGAHSQHQRCDQARIRSSYRCRLEPPASGPCLQRATPASVDRVLSGTSAASTSAARGAFSECGVRRRRCGCAAHHGDER